MRKKYQSIEKEVCKNAIIFARVSSEKQEKGASIDAQKETIYRYCKNKNLNIIKEYVITESTMRGDRKQYHEMLNFVIKYKGKIAIVVNCVDRLQRSDKDNPILDELRREDKIEVHFIKENMILTKDSNGYELMFWKMQVLMANSYVISLSSNVKRSLELNWSQGKWQGYAPLGYINKKDNNNKSTLVIDEERASIITHLFKTFASGEHTLKTIWLLSKELGLTSKLKNKPICKNTIYNILTNPFYYGEMFIKGKSIKHIYTPLIDKTTFDKVQNIFVANGNHNRTNTEEYAKTPYTFRGIIHCKECGCLITPETKIKPSGKSYTYLRCGHPCKNCHQGIVNQNIILEQIKKEVFDKLTLPINLQEPLKKAILKELNDTSKFNAITKANITSKLNELKDKEDTLLDFYLEGKINQSLYETKQSSIAKERKELEDASAKYKEITEDIKENVNNIISTASNITNLFETSTPTYQNELLKLLFKDCKLTGNKIEYTLNKPFDKLLTTNQTKWCNLVIENLLKSE